MTFSTVGRSSKVVVLNLSMAVLVFSTSSSIHAVQCSG